MTRKSILLGIAAMAVVVSASAVVAQSPYRVQEPAPQTTSKVDPRTSTSVTVLLAPPGSVVGKFDGAATKEQLVAKLQAAQSDPCAGGKCGPGGCGPKR